MSSDRNTLPGNPPTDEELRHEIELTRQELSSTLARILYKTNVPARTRDTVQAKVTQAKQTATRARRHPVALAGLLATLSGLIALWLWIRR